MKSLKEIRLEMGLTQKQMAEILCVHRSTVSMVECNNRFLPTEANKRLKRIAAAAERTNPADTLMEELSEREEAWTRHKLEYKLFRMNLRKERNEKRIKKLEKLHESSTKLLRFLTREIKVFGFLPDYAYNLQRWYYKAKEDFTASLPACRSELLASVRLLESDIRELKVQLAA